MWVLYLGTISTLGSRPWFSNLSHHHECTNVITVFFGRNHINRSIYPQERAICKECTMKWHPLQTTHLWLGKLMGLGTAGILPKTVIPRRVDTPLHPHNKSPWSIAQIYFHESPKMISKCHRKTPKYNWALISEVVTLWLTYITKQLA